MTLINYITKRIITWIIIYLILSVVISFLLSRYFLRFSDAELTFMYLFYRTLIVTYSIGMLATPAGYFVLNYFFSKTNIIRISAVVLTAVCAAIIGNTIGCNIISSIDNTAMYKIKLNDLVINLLLVTIITLVTIAIEDILRRKNELLIDLHHVKNKLNSDFENQSVSFKNEDGYHTVKFNELIYLSSHGKKSAYHTINDSYVVNQLLKDIVQTLPPELFLRVHKQYIININFLKQIKYYEGGGYLAYLNDEDETIIPVSRSQGTAIKEKFDF